MQWLLVVSDKLLWSEEMDIISPCASSKLFFVKCVPLWGDSESIRYCIESDSLYSSLFGSTTEEDATNETESKHQTVLFFECHVDHLIFMHLYYNALKEEDSCGAKHGDIEEMCVLTKREKCEIQRNLDEKKYLDYNFCWFLYCVLSKVYRKTHMFPLFHSCDTIQNFHTWF